MAKGLILMRAWHPSAKRMYDVTTISFVKEMLWGKCISDNTTIADRLQNFVLMEWTGIKDKKNVPIFDGDIIWNDDYPIYGIVIHEPGLFVIKYPDNVNLLLNNPRGIQEQKLKLEVKGNVYQNLDILKGGEVIKMDNQPAQPVQPTTEPAPVAPVVAQPATPAPEPQPAQPVPAPVQAGTLAQPEATAADKPVQTRIELARERLNDALVLLREELEAKNRGVGARELAHAITLIEDGCMNMNRSQFADIPYDPRLKLKKAE